MFVILMLLTATAATPQSNSQRIELFAPPIPIKYAPPHVPTPVYGAPPSYSPAPVIPSEGTFFSPAPSPDVPGTPSEGSFFSPTPARAPSSPVDELLNVPQNAIPVPAESPEIVLPPGTRLSLRDHLGQFSHGYSDKKGTTVSEQGRLLNTNDGWEAVIVKKGFYSYISPEGTPISVSYIADENGFRATGDHIPS